MKVFSMYNENNELVSKMDLNLFMYKLNSMKDLDVESIENILRYTDKVRRKKSTLTVFRKVNFSMSRSIFLSESDEFMDEIVYPYRADLKRMLEVLINLSNGKNTIISLEKYKYIDIIFKVTDFARLADCGVVSPLDLVECTVRFNNYKIKAIRTGVYSIDLYYDKKFLTTILLPSNEYFSKREIDFDYAPEDYIIVAKWLHFIYTNGTPNYEATEFKKSFERYYKYRMNKEVNKNG